MIVRPRELKGLPCGFEVNPILRSGFYEYGLKGQIGDGWFWGDDDLVFRIYVPPQMAKDLLAYRELKEQIAMLDDDDEPAWLRVSIAISQYRASRDGEKVLFNIDSVSS